MPYHSTDSGREEDALRTVEECSNHPHVRQRDWLPSTKRTLEDKMGLERRLLFNRHRL